MKGNNDKELKTIKDFITKINNGKINESNAASEFKKFKKKVNNDKLKHDLVKYLEKHLFGEEFESIDPEEKYQESVGERVKTKLRKTSAPSKIDSSKEAADYLEYKENKKKVKKDLAMIMIAMDGLVDLET